MAYQKSTNLAKSRSVILGGGMDILGWPGGDAERTLSTGNRSKYRVSPA